MIDLSGVHPRSMLGAVLRFPLRFIPRGLEVKVIGGPNRGRSWTVGAATHGCWLGTYESAKVTAISAFVRPGMVVYDLGANAGYYTLLFAQAVGAAGRVIAVEPLAENVVHLMRHIARNDFTNCTVVQAAISNRPGLGSFQRAESPAMGALTSSPTGLNIPTMTLDELVAECGEPGPDLVKIDVEGAEADVLEGAAELLSRGRTTWFVAIHGDEQRRRCHVALTALGYRVFTVEGDPVHVVQDGAGPDEIYAVPG